MTALVTRQSYARFARRFATWRAASPAGAGDLTGEVVAFITAAVPAVSRRNAAYALRAALRDALDWPRVKAAVMPLARRSGASAAPVARTTEKRAQYTRRFERWTAEHLELIEPTARVTAFLAGLTPSQHRAARLALRASLDGAVDWSRVPRARYARNEPVLRDTVLAAGERAQLAALTPTLRERALLAACYVLRRFEVAALRWRDVNLADGSVFVARGKGGRAAWTLLPPGPLAALRAWHAEAQPATPELPVFPAARTKPATVDADGCPTADTVGHWVRAILRRAGLGRRHRGAHALRRTFASAFLERHPDQLVHLQRLMRHSRLDTTQLYVYLSPDALKTAVSELDL